MACMLPLSVGVFSPLHQARGGCGQLVTRTVFDLRNLHPALCFCLSFHQLLEPRGANSSECYRSNKIHCILYLLQKGNTCSLF